MKNKTLLKTVLAFIWCFPFLYIFLDKYFEIDFKIPLNILSDLVYFSLACSTVLLIMWYKEFSHISYLDKSFKYLEAGYLDKLDRMLNKTSPSIYYKNGQTLLTFAVNQQLDNETIMYLLSKGCYASFSRSIEFDLSYTLFYICSYLNDLTLPMIEFLVKNGANVNYIDNSNGFDGLSTLHSLILRGDLEATRYLLDQGANVDYLIEELSVNALMLAIKYNEDIDIIKLLLEYGSQVEEINKNGYNAILFAAHYNPNPSTINLLLTAGARIKPYNIRGNAMNYSEVTPLMLAASYNNINVVKRLLNSGDDPSFKDNYGLSVIFMAAAHNSDVSIIKELLNSGVSLENSKDNEENTPLMAAAFLSSNPLVIKYLINRSHNLQSTNIEGLTFIDFLYQNSNLSNEEKNSILNYD